MSSRPQPQSDTETPPSTDSRTTETPAELANLMASHLLVTPPEPTDRILIPGANAGELRDAVTAHCTDHEYASPTCVSTSVTSEGGSNDTDFLLNPPEGEFEYIIANPPRSIFNAISPDTRQQYSDADYATFEGRPKLSKLFFEQALRCLAPGGTLVFLTPLTHFTDYESDSFRNLLRRHTVHNMFVLPSDSLSERSEPPVLTVLSKPESGAKTSPDEFSSIRIELLQEPTIAQISDADQSSGTIFEDYTDLFRRAREDVLRRESQESASLERNPFDYPEVWPPYTEPIPAPTSPGSDSGSEENNQSSFDSF